MDEKHEFAGNFAMCVTVMTFFVLALGGFANGCNNTTRINRLEEHLLEKAKATTSAKAE